MPERSFYDEDSINDRWKRFQRRRRHQADLKTMIANGVYGMSAITALTAQNTTGVQGIFEVTPEFLEQEIDSVFTDIRPDAVKIGMVSSAGLIKSIAKKLHEHKAENIVVDPVMVATSGSKLISDDAIGTLKEYLFPMAAVLTRISRRQRFYQGWK